MALTPDGVEVRLCFTQPAGSLLLPHESVGTGLVDAAYLGADPRRTPLSKSARGFKLPANTGAGDCVYYRVAYSKLGAVSQQQRHPRAMRFDDGWLLAPEYWLWHTEPATDLPVQFALDDGTEAGVPWPALRPGQARYLIPADAHKWGAVGALGTPRQIHIDAGSLRLRVTGLGLSAADYQGWLRASASAAGLPFRQLKPEPALAILMPQRAGASSFGMAYRGGGRSTLLRVGDAARTGDIGAEWSATHEFFHLLMPYVRLEDAWFTEGLATYYTALVRGRVGALSERQVWWELVDGFERGSATAGALPLAEESEQMRANRSYWRVYWSGAAIALAWEVSLIDAGKNLDSLVSKLASYDREGSQLWTAEDLMRRADRELGTNLWPVAEATLSQRAFFDYRPALSALGVHGDSQSLSFGAGRLAGQRRQLTQLVQEPTLVKAPSR